MEELEALRKENETLKNQLQELRKDKDIFERLFNAESKKYERLKQVFESFKTIVASVKVE